GEVRQIFPGRCLQGSAGLLLKDLMDQVESSRPIFALSAPLGVVEPLLRQGGIVFRVLILWGMEIEAAGQAGDGPGSLPPFGGIGDALLDLGEDLVELEREGGLLDILRERLGEPAIAP